MRFFGQDKREPAIDIFRGFIVLAMLTATFFGISDAVWEIVPDILKHAPADGITIADFFAPAFLFVMGLSAAASFERRKADSGKRAYMELFYKGGALIALQAIINQIDRMISGQASVMWGILSALGIALIFALPLIGRKFWIRCVGAAAYVGLYTLLCQGFKLTGEVTYITQGGLIGGLNWSFVLLLGTIVGELVQKSRGKWLTLILGAALIGAGIGLNFWVPFSKHAVSAAYVLLTGGTSAVFFIGFYYLAKVWKERANFCVWVGRNAILFFLADQLLSAILGAGLLEFIYPTASAFTVILGAVLNIAVWSALAYLLYRKKVFLKI